MSSDPLLAVEGLTLTQRVEALKRTATKLAALRDKHTEDLEAKTAEVDDLTKRIELLGKVHELFHTLMDLMVVKQVRAVEAIVTEGLQTIFGDDYYFEADVGPKWGKVSVDFSIRKGPTDGPNTHSGPPLESFGGGPSSLASLTLRVLTVLRLKLWPMFVLDEALGAVSDEFVDQTGLFLRQLAEKAGVDIMLITHKTAFRDHAHKSYQCAQASDDEGAQWVTLGGAREV